MRFEIDGSAGFGRELKYGFIWDDSVIARVDDEDFPAIDIFCLRERIIEI